MLAQLPPPPTSEQERALPLPPGLFYSLFAFGFLIAVIGHLFRARSLVAAGIALVFLSSGVFVILSVEAAR